jgi:hypothetical protein
MLREPEMIHLSECGPGVVARLKNEVGAGDDARWRSGG